MPRRLSLCWLALGALLAAVGSAQAKGGGGSSSGSYSSVKSPSKWTSNKQVYTRTHTQYIYIQ
jgi:hypothetical protein